MKWIAGLAAFALLATLVAANVSAEETDLDLSLLNGKARGAVQTGESITFSFVLANTGSVAQTVTIYAATAYYWADPGFSQEVYVDGALMGGYFPIEMAPGESVSVDLVIWAYACTTQMPYYYVELTASSALDTDMVRVDVQRAGQ